MKAIQFRPMFLGLFLSAFSFSVLGQSTYSSSQPPQAASVFNANCAMCHGADGTGTPTGKSLNAPNLRSAAVQKQSNAALSRFIRDGKDRMPSFKSQLTGAQIMAQASYVHWLGHHKVSQ